jgi:hypothetical protein
MNLSNTGVSKALKKKKIDIRIKALRFNLDHLNSAYADTTRDSVVDTGIEYGKEYPYNDETRELFKKHEDLKKSREEILFFTIFNFTQVYYSIKEYLKKEYPSQKEKIEAFFSDRPLGFMARKDISNDLKHNPSNDIQYKIGQIAKTEKFREGTSLIIRTNYRETWFYYGIDSVEYCNHLYKELSEFMDKEIDTV